MNETYYIVDTNALTALKRRRIQTSFFATHCRVTSDVNRELPEHPDRDLLVAREIELNPAVIEQLRVVMAALEPGDIELVDLYKNRGMADPGLIASALVAQAAEGGQLFPDAWVLVTNDSGVQRMADRLGVPTMKPAGLAQLIDSSTSG